MNAFGVVLAIAGVAGMVGGFFFDGSVASGLHERVANLSLMNFKLLLVTAGGSAFIAGCVLVGADAIRQAIVHSASGSTSSTMSKPELFA